MFCRNCGKELDPNAVACMQCGHDPTKGNKHCPNCGVPVEAAQVVCIKCGGSLATVSATPRPGDVSDKSKIAYLLLGIFLGGLGIHNFYAGYTSKGVAQLLITILSCFILSWVVCIWALIEAITVEVDADGKKFAN